MHTFPKTTKDLRLLLVEPHPGLREPLADLLGTHRLPVLVTGDRDAAVAAVRDWEPTVAVVDPSRWHGQAGDYDELLNALDAVADLHTADPRLPIVLHTVTVAWGMLLDLTRLGVVRHVSTDSPSEILLAAVRDAHAVSCWRAWSAAGEVAR